ncbi:nuclear transport factor 2 family protein [Streptomyces sp. L7]
MHFDQRIPGDRLEPGAGPTWPTRHWPRTSSSTTRTCPTDGSRWSSSSRASASSSPTHGSRSSARRARGDLVFVHTHFRATSTDRGSVVVEVFRLEGGLIVEHWDVRDEIPETTVSGHDVV